MGAESSVPGNLALFLYYLIAAVIIVAALLWGKPAQRVTRSLFSSGQAFRQFLTIVELPKQKLRRSPKWRVGPMPASQFYEKGYDQPRQIAQQHPESAGVQDAKKS